MKKYLCKVLVLFMIASIYMFVKPINTNAEDNNTQKYYLGEAVNAGKDNGYSNNDEIKSGDVHFGWTLGNFYVSGYTSAKNCETDCPVFLKNVGDQLVLKFELKQDINKLNGKDNLYICSDTDGYDNRFGVTKTTFGKGALIIKHTDYQNNTTEPQIYTNFLDANASSIANSTVELNEEGDYEVTLDYEIIETAGPFDLLSSYSNYKIYFKFSVRNGNCMVYPFDTATGAELTNASVTENGFYLDLAKSRYIDISIKKEILNEGKDGLVEDTRFNRPAKDGDKYTDEGIYTITAKNNYTNQETVKKIYVGKDNIMKASVFTDLSVSEINKLVASGATIDNNGSIIPASNNQNDTTSDEKQSDSQGYNDKILYLCAGLGCLIILIITVVIIGCRRKRKNKKADEDIKKAKTTNEVEKKEDNDNNGEDI